ncbi:PrsW family glutamic-type intramembrane protease [Helcococcus bovis]|uniref:PrsW family glutamic-type intramembrane protease n=1 Tax=Helcococcus bovis TaxID=3153252 RepID=UPI0038BA98BB
MIRKILLLIISILSFIRIKEEYLIFDTLIKSNTNLSSFFLAILSFGIYISPLAIMSYIAAKKYKLKFSYFLISIFFGLFVISHWSGIANIKFHDILSGIIKNKQFMDTWGPSIVPVIVEEGFKLTLALIIIYIFNIKDIFNILLVGIGVGLGYQFSEDYTYILGAMIEGKNIFSEVLSRFSSAFAGHWIFNAFLTTGVGYLIFYKEKRKEYLSYFWIILPFLLHAIWNSPYVEKYPMLIYIIIPISWAFLFKLVKDIINTRKNNYGNI